MNRSELGERRDAVARHAVLARQLDRLHSLLAPLLEGPIHLPTEKALLSQDGGVCPRDGSRLRFDPLSPSAHRCPRCGETFEGERHYRSWVWRYQIWLSERAIHFALVGSLGGDRSLRERSASLLSAYSSLYNHYPNRDNVLGPTRLFFSTYLESIWLLQLIIAARLLDADPADSVLDAVRSRFSEVAGQSASLIASFDEGWSNRQVWNNAAMLAAGSWLEDRDLVHRALDGPHGLRAQLERAVGEDGMWFEGENYHFFALRGFTLAAEVARVTGEDLYGKDGGKLGAMFVATLRTMLPDLTFPARGDSPYGVSALQPRFAELWEIGRVRTGHQRIETTLAALYAARAPEGEDHGLDEISEIEQNRPPARLMRERLGWRALLWMDPNDPVATEQASPPAVDVLEDQGLVILRPAADRYVSVECGRRSGGHAHPDLLHLTAFWSVPWLVDPGTGSYVTPSLHWYRSTLAHNAPGMAGVGQEPAEAWCVAADAAGEWSWSRSVSVGLFGATRKNGEQAARTSAIRSVVVGPEYQLDVVDVDPGDVTEVDLPVHVLGTWNAGEPAEPADLLDRASWAGHEHGYDFGRHTRSLSHTPAIAIDQGSKRLDLFLAGRAGEHLFLVEAPGPPDLAFADGKAVEFLVRRARGPGRWVSVMAAAPTTVTGVREESGDIIVSRADGPSDRITIDDEGVSIVEGTGRRVRLAGLRRVESTAHTDTRSARVVGRGTGAPSGEVFMGVKLDTVPAPGNWTALIPADARIPLGEAEYRRSEEPWATSPISAELAFFACGTRIGFAIDVTKRDLIVRAPDSPDPALDNETPDIHSDGVQWYVAMRTVRAFLILPCPTPPGIRVRPIGGADASLIAGQWTPTSRGYAMVTTMDVGHVVERGERFHANLIVNEMRPERQRRAGQLALSGGGGWVYLRGDRESPAGMVEVEVV